MLAFVTCQPSLIKAAKKMLLAHQESVTDPSLTSTPPAKEIVQRSPQAQREMLAMLEFIGDYIREQNHKYAAIIQEHVENAKAVMVPPELTNLIVQHSPP